jgi:hypothetical protein
MSVTSTFYRRPLPEGLIVFSSPEGKALFREALEAGTMEGFFALSEQFHTQAEPAFCGLGSLVVALNALGIDPGRLWKGPWRWFDESLLDCCVPLEVVAKRGVTLGELACLAECNGARASIGRATDGAVDAFRRDVVRGSKAAGDRVIIAAYHRGALGQSGTGHYSPLGGYHAPSDRVLVLDVARFKYPPHWVPLPLLFDAMRAIDADTGKPRGWVNLERSSTPRPLFVRLGVPSTGWRAMLEAITADVRARIVAPTAGDFARAIMDFEPARREVIEPLATAMDGDLPEQHRLYVDALLREVRALPAYRTALAARRAATSPFDSSGAGATSASLAPEIAVILGSALARVPLGPDTPFLSAEIAAVERQLEALCAVKPVVRSE